MKVAEERTREENMAYVEGIVIGLTMAGVPKVDHELLLCTRSGFDNRLFDGLEALKHKRG